MFKKVLSLSLSVMMIMAFVAIPSMAAEEGSFSEANWHQFERGFYTSTSDFGQYFSEYTDTSYGDEQLTAVKMVATSGKTITSNRNPVAYKIGDSPEDHYGEYVDETATYAHMRFYLASFSDQYRTAMNKIQLRLDKDGTGSSRDTFLIHSWKEGSTYATSVYPTSYSSSAAYTSKDWLGIAHQGFAGNGPADNVTANSHQTALSEANFDKFDLIVEYNKQGGATSYLFVNGKFMGSYYDSGLTDKHFHGIVLRLSKDYSPKTRGNSDYIATKFDADRIGHREYYNTDDYMVTMEDVMQDAGLGDTLDEENMIYKSKAGDLEWYMPGNNYGLFTEVYTYETGYSARQQINPNVTYSGTAATIVATNTDTEEYAVAAKMLSGFYPINGKTGISYEDYHPRAKYIKLSFDQTISNSDMWLEYKTRYSGTEQALQMWNNGGNLVVGIKGGSNITCNGNGSKPAASMTGTNYIDWILEPDEANSCMNQYVYINGKYAGKGSFGNQYAVRVCDIILGTRNSAGTITIDNWSMSLYNSMATFEDIGLEAPPTEDEVLVEIPAPEHKNVKVLFEEDFEGETADSLALTYPRTTRINDGTSISYWGKWDGALTEGFDSEAGIFACAGVASNNSRTFEAYVPTDINTHKGLVNLKFNFKPRASISRQQLFMFRSENYAAADDIKNGVLIFENADISRYAGKWLEVNIWVDLDNDTYLYNIYDTETSKVIKQGEGTQKFNNLGGFVVKLKGSDSETDYSEIAPVIDNIYFASAQRPDPDAFRIKTFAFDGANSNITFEIGENISEDADIYMGLYSGSNLLKSVSKLPVTLNEATKTVSTSVDNSGAANGDSYRLFVWGKETLKPFFKSIDSNKKVYPFTIKDNADFHSSSMRAYLADSVENCKTYADGTVAAEEPMPITFDWVGDESCNYVLKVSENSDMSSPWIFTTEETTYDVYNLKIGTRYYWTVDAVKDSSTIYTTDIQTFTTIDEAPRNLLIGGGVRNVRDIGGWKTADGKRVKQGLIFRSSALDTWDSDMDRPNLLVSKGGIETMTKLLGIKTEIDFRQDSDDDSFPEGKSTSILGENVAYFHCPMDYGDYLTRNFESIRNIFGVLSNANNYPVTYHCAVGADRTGAITYLINGLLGVSKEDLKRDYMMTNFSYQSKYRAPVTDAYVAILDSYTGSTLQEKIYNYLSIEVGVPASTLDFIIDYLTE